MGSRPITFLWLWPVTDHEPNCRHVPINIIRRWTESTPQSVWWRSHMAGFYSDCSTREIKNSKLVFSTSNWFAPPFLIQTGRIWVRQKHTTATPTPYSVCNRLCRKVCNAVFAMFAEVVATNSIQCLGVTYSCCNSATKPPLFAGMA